MGKEGRLAKSNNVRLGLRFKLLSAILILFVITISSFSYFAINLISESQKSFIFENLMSKNETYINELANVIKRLEGYSVTFAFNNYKAIVINEFLERDTNLLAVKIKSNQETSIFINKNYIQNSSLKSAIDNVQDWDGKNIFEKDIAFSIDPDIPEIGVYLKGQRKNDFVYFRVQLPNFEDFFSGQGELVSALVHGKGDALIQNENAKKLKLENIPKLFNFKEGVRELTNQKGIISSLNSIGELDLHVVSAIPMQELTDISLILIKKTLGFTIFLFGALILLGLLITRAIAKPIEGFVEATNQIASGDYDLKLNLNTNDEFRVLGKSIQNMSQNISELLSSKQNVINLLEEAQVKLADYNKNLEKKVMARTRELSDLNKFVDATINSIDQSLLVVDENHRFKDFCTKASKSMFGNDFPGKEFYDVIKPDNISREDINEWMKNLFIELLPFDDLLALGPSRVKIKNRIIALSFFPMRSEGKVDNIVVLGTDVTDKSELEQRQIENESKVKRLLNFLNNKSHFFSYVKDFKSFVTSLKDESVTELEIKNELHTFKGGAYLLAFKKTGDFVHELENALASDKDTFFHDKSSYLEELESVFKSEISEIKSVIGPQNFQINDFRKEVSMKHLRVFRSALSVNGHMKLKKYFDSKFYKTRLATRLLFYREHILNLAYENGKEVSDFKIMGRDLYIDPEHFESFSANLVHVYKNIIAHGLEYPYEREGMGKKGGGIVETEIGRFGSNHFFISIKDDGRGIDYEALKEKTQAEEGLTRQEVFMKIFEADTTTKDEVDELSGRGVGLSSLKSELDKIGGDVSIESSLGEGTTFTFILRDII